MLEETRITNEQNKRVFFILDNISSALENLSLKVNPLADEFIRRYFYTNDKATKMERGTGFKKKLIVFYYEVHYAVSELKCMFSGIVLPVQVVIGAHLFKSCWAKDCQARLGFDEIDNPRNGLLLFKPFEYAFDNSHICFQFDAQNEWFSMKILDPELRNLTIKEYILKEKEIDCTLFLKSRDDWRNTFKMNPHLTDEDMSSRMEAVDNLLKILDQKFSTFEGKYLEHIEGKKCFGRCLSFQASMARLLAIENCWITKEDFDSPSMFSELENKKKEQLSSWFKALEPHNVGKEIDD
jgi:hypothetical protein